MGVYLSTPKTDKVSVDGENSRLRYGCSSMQGWRATMEDAHAAFPDLDDSTSFFGVYDGHGGFLVAKFCAKFLHQEVLNHEAYATGDLSTSLRAAFLRMDEMMRGESGRKELDILKGIIELPSDTTEQFYPFPDEEEEEHSEYPGPTSGSTACVAVIRNRQVIVANAGDSRCVLSRKGQAIALSEDHKPELEVEKERILKAGGSIQMGRVNGSLNLARAIGDTELKRNKSLPAEEQILTANPDLKVVELSDDDEFLLVACDGIWDCFSNQELVDYVRDQLITETKLSAVCEKVFDKCLAPTSDDEGCDNMTMILVQFKKPDADVIKQPPPSDEDGQNLFG